MNKQSNPYALTEQDKQDIIKRLTQDVDWSQDETETEFTNHSDSEQDEEGLF